MEQKGEREGIYRGKDMKKRGKRKDRNSMGSYKKRKYRIKRFFQIRVPKNLRNPNRKKNLRKTKRKYRKKIKRKTIKRRK